MVRSLRNRIVVASLLSLSSMGLSSMGMTSIGISRAHVAEVNSLPAALTVNLYNHAQASEATLSVAKAEAARILR